MHSLNTSTFFYALGKHRVLLLMLLPAVFTIFIFNYLPMAGLVAAFKVYDNKAGLFGTSYKLTNQSLDELDAQGVPKDQLKKLKTMRNRRFTEKKAFLEQVEKRIGAKLTAEYGTRIIRNSDSWIGFKNFGVLLKTGALWRITRNTVLYNMIFLAFTQSFQILMAIFLSETVGKLYKKVAQGLMFIPYFVSFVILGAFVYNILNYEFGALNTLLRSLNLPLVDAYTTPGLWPLVIVAAHTWKWMGYGTVIFLAATMTIDTGLYEAASVDGAGKWQQIWHITLPGIAPTIIICTLINVGRIMKGQFELFFNIVGFNGQLYEYTDVIDTFVFRALVRNFDIGLGTATGLYQSVFGLILVLLANYLVKCYEPDYALF